MVCSTLVTSDSWAAARQWKNAWYVVECGLKTLVVTVFAYIGRKLKVCDDMHGWQEFGSIWWKYAWDKEMGARMHWCMWCEKDQTFNGWLGRKTLAKTSTTAWMCLIDKLCLLLLSVQLFRQFLKVTSQLHHMHQSFLWTSPYPCPTRFKAFVFIIRIFPLPVCPPPYTVLLLWLVWWSLGSSFNLYRPEGRIYFTYLEGSHDNVHRGWKKQDDKATRIRPNGIP